MNSIGINKVVRYVENNISSFHTKRLQNLELLKLDKILKRKNPYLFKSKNILTAHDLVKVLLDAHLSSQEETIFGEFLEGLARFICEQIYGGKKSSAEGIDLEFSKEGIHYLVSIKSGPNWGNSRQIKKMKDDFLRTIRILKTNNPKIHVAVVNGCCYGKDNKPEKGNYQKLCGQRFWEFISGDETLYTAIIEPLGHKAKQRNDRFHESYAQIINKFTQQFMNDFCVNGKINWEKLVEFNSGK
jgi:hypothetical protein